MMKSNDIVQKTKLAKVIGNSKYNEGTLLVQIKFARKNIKYKKIETRFTKLQVQYDSKEQIQIGSYVYIMPCRPVSKTKRWKVQSVKDGN